MKEEVMDWQPIESAPKDGTCIMLAIAGAPPFRTIPIVGTGRWTIEGPHYVGWDGSASGVIRLINPTHWMPLPEPPQ